MILVLDMYLYLILTLNLDNISYHPISMEYHSFVRFARMTNDFNDQSVFISKILFIKNLILSHGSWHMAHGYRVNVWIQLISQKSNKKRVCGGCII